jgi:RimJ/RimL family protein N-acetyltransferase
MIENCNHYLRAFKKEEVHLYKEWVSSREIMGPYVNLEKLSLRSLFDEFGKGQWQNNEISRWLFCHKRDEGIEEVLGFGHAWRFDRYEKHMEFGRVLLPAFRGKGIGSYLLWSLLNRIFDHFPETDRLQAITACSNRACLRTWEKLGVQTEGRLRHFMTLEEQHVDCYLGSILRNEWKTTCISKLNSLNKDCS